MSSSKIPNFSQIICGAAPVRAIFDSHKGAHLWWKMILLLHGKPVDVTLSSAQRTRLIMEGFKFYAALYRSLAIVFLVVSVAFAALINTEEGASFMYWASASLGAALYLWDASSIGMAGSQTYRHNPTVGRTILLGFMVMVVAFLSLFVGVISAAIHYVAGISTLLNLAATTLFFVFGIGSYGIEIIFLSSEKEHSPNETS